ncbi:MAG TPA: hypothetical protein VM143_03890 [Acidimicrobiales bacterium]|nr:hypothetical protein [Acidimicrobiales bacterium]
MSHVRDFLTAAAPEPSRPIDAAAVVRRARSSTWQRGVAWGAGVVAAILAAGGGWAQLAPAGPEGGTSQEAAHVRGPEIAASGARSSSGREIPVAARFASEQRGAPANGSAGIREAAPANGAAPESQAGDDADFGPSWSFSRQPSKDSEGCSARTGEVESCTYVATRPGGYRAGGTYRIVIERDGQTAVYDTPAEDQPKGNPCRDVGFILPGDRVTVSVPPAPEQWPSESPNVTTQPGRSPPPPPPGPPPLGSVSVGPDAHC